MPEKTAFLKEDTWIKLFRPYEIKLSSLTPKNNWRKIGDLSEKIMKQIIDCLFKYHEEDISELHESWLRPLLTASIEKLKEKFK
ncbi:MAG: hypothetical protein JRJ49_02660 [Deltaproteobacteria bacterium]|nr:hypothetical protein [Deltaproteobacteria bacterium]